MSDALAGTEEVLAPVSETVNAKDKVALVIELPSE